MKTHIDLFSGIGGFALAARWAGIQTIQFVEIDKFCHKVLNKNFKGVPIWDDIKTFHNTTNATDLCPGNSQQGDAPSQGCGELSTEGRNTDNPSIDGGHCNCNSITSTRGETSGNIQGEKDDIKTFTNTGCFGQEVSQEQTAGIKQCIKRPFLLTGGFPCQPFSCAGQRKGTGDDRHLWPHMLRVIQEFHPRWIIAENVGGIVNIKNMEQQDSETDLEDETIDGGEDSGTTSVLISILDDLEASGYSVQIFIIPACSLNAPHRRDRVWIVANTINPDSNGCFKYNSTTETEPIRGAETTIMPTDSNVRHTKSNRTGSGTPTSGTDGNRTEIIKEQQLPQSGYSGQDCHSSTGLQGGIISQWSNDTMPNRGENWEQNWLEVATRLCRVDDGIPRQVDRVNRLKALGNAIVPQVAFELMKAILEVEATNETK